MAKARSGGGRHWLLIWLPPLGALLVFACVFVVLHWFYDPFGWFHPFRAYTPQWSPDGRQIVFGCEQGEIYQDAICVRAADRDGQRLIRPNQARFSYVHTLWSPDGKTLLSSGFGVYRMDADGANGKTLSASGSGAVWSPDGRQIAFSDSSSIFVMNADGSGRRKLAAVSSLLSDSEVRWSPDGKHLLYANDKSYHSRATFLYVVSVDGYSPPVRLGSGEEGDWSPDGRRIAFSHDRSVWLMNADGSERKRLTQGEYDGDGAPRFSPSGRHLVFLSDRSITHRVCLLSLDDGSIVAFDTGFSPAFSPDGRRLAFVDPSPAPGASGIRVVELGDRAQ